jgi:predicted CoA-binding protein
MPLATSDADLRAILVAARRIAVVGLSDNAMRPSHGVAAYLQACGYAIYPVNPVLRGQQVLGRTVYSSLAELPEPPDVVDVFRRPEYLPQLVDDAIAAQVKVLWTQLGVIHAEALQRASAAGIMVVVDRCSKVEHMRLGIGRVG